MHATLRRSDCACKLLYVTPEGLALNRRLGDTLQMLNQVCTYMNTPHKYTCIHTQTHSHTPVRTIAFRPVHWILSP